MATDWKVRVLEECDELTKKVDKLLAFIADAEGNTTAGYDRLSSEQQFLLRTQLQIMFLYVDILDRRLVGA